MKYMKAREGTMPPWRRGCRSRLGETALLPTLCTRCVIWSVHRQYRHQGRQEASLAAQLRQSLGGGGAPARPRRCPLPGTRRRFTYPVIAEWLPVSGCGSRPAAAAPLPASLPATRYMLCPSRKGTQRRIHGCCPRARRRPLPGAFLGTSRQGMLCSQAVPPA